MKKLSVTKFALLVCLLCALFAFITKEAAAQDTIPVQKILVANQLINRKTGKVERTFFKKIKVKKGYIIRQKNGWYVINGKEMLPNTFSFKDSIAKK